MKIAVATQDGMVAAHFGRCPQYTIAEVEEGSVIRQTVVPNPGHEPGVLPGFLAGQGVKCMIAGGMGPRAQNLFAGYGIDVIVGADGPVDEVVFDHIGGRLETGEDLCEHH